MALDTDDDFLEGFDELERDDCETKLVMPALKCKKTYWQRIERLRDRRLLKKQLEDFGDWEI